MNNLILKAANREVLGKKARFLRRRGITPTHVFGREIESLALQCDTVELQHIIARAGMTRPFNLEIENEKEPRYVLIREIQTDSISRGVLHVDFYHIRKGEKIKVDVPIVLTGEAPAMKGKGRMLSHGITRLSIECLPGNVPPQIEIDLSQLKDLEQAIYVKDIVLDPSITVHADPDQLVAKIVEVAIEKAEVVEKVAVEAEAEVEAGAEAGAPGEGKPEQQRETGTATGR